MKNSESKLLFLSTIVGFSVMVVELTATRILAPILGNTIYTWTTVIGIVLLGSSIGNHFGGKLIDKDNRSIVISKYFFSSSIFVLLIIPIAKLFAESLLLVPYLLISNIIASALFFFVPAYLLGNIYPMLAKQYLIDIDLIGKRAGALSAFAALGSIIGTFMTGYFFIGYLGTTYTLILISFLLLCCGITLVNQRRIKYTFITIFFVLSIFLININKLIDDNSLVYETDSNYYQIKVKDKQLSGVGKVRVLFLDGGSNNVESQEGKIFDSYVNLFPLFGIFNNDIKQVAVLGGGSMEIPDNIKKYYPDSTITTAEIDPKVTEIAKNFFAANDENLAKTVAMDGRIFLKKSDVKYDIIFSDAFNSFISVPWHLTTSEFFNLSKQKLDKDGIFAMNIISAVEGKDAKFFDSMYATFAKTYKNHYVFAYEHGNLSNMQNIVLVGLNSKGHLSNELIKEYLLNFPEGEKMADHLLKIEPKQSSLLLTDDFAPTDRITLSSINRYFNVYLKYIGI